SALDLLRRGLGEFQRDETDRPWMTGRFCVTRRVTVGVACVGDLAGHAGGKLGQALFCGRRSNKTHGLTGGHPALHPLNRRARRTGGLQIAIYRVAETTTAAPDRIMLRPRRVDSAC